MRTINCSFLCLALCGALPISARAQTPADLNETVSAGFIYCMPSGTYNQKIGAPGYNLGYSYKLRSWLALDAGFQQVIHPAAAIAVHNNALVNYINPGDQLFLVPFGARFLWSPSGSRMQIGIRAGGAYIDHHYNASAFGYFASSSGLGPHVNASLEFPISASGHFRLGISASYYYLNPHSDSGGPIVREFTFGPSLLYSFRLPAK